MKKERWNIDIVLEVKVSPYTAVLIFFTPHLWTLVIKERDNLSHTHSHLWAEHQLTWWACFRIVGGSRSTQRKTHKLHTERSTLPKPRFELVAFWLWGSSANYSDSHRAAHRKHLSMLNLQPKFKHFFCFCEEKNSVAPVMIEKEDLWKQKDKMISARSDHV